MQVFHGKSIVAGIAEGESLVTAQPLYFNWVDLETGEVRQAGSNLYKKSVTNKILIVPSFVCNIDMWKLYRICLHQKGPIGIITPLLSDDYMIVGSILVDLPLVHLVSPDPIASIREGQRVRIDNDTISVLN